MGREHARGTGRTARLDARSRGHGALGRLAATALAGVTVVACSGQPDLVQPSPTGPVADQCAAVMAALPQTVMGLGRTSTDGNVATWGEQRLSVRCGVDKPAALDAAARCDMVAGVGWFSEDPGTAVRSAWRFTTIGRSGYLEVIVPERLEPAGDALVDLAEAVKLLPETRPCV